MKVRSGEEERGEREEGEEVWERGRRGKKGEERGGGRKELNNKNAYSIHEVCASNPTLWPMMSCTTLMPLHHNDVVHYLDAVFTVEVSSPNACIEIEL